MCSIDLASFCYINILGIFYHALAIFFLLSSGNADIWGFLLLLLFDIYLSIHKVVLNGYHVLTAYIFMYIYIYIYLLIYNKQQVSLVVKNPPASKRDTKDMASIPGLERSPGERNGNPVQYSCLENPMDRGAWWATVHGGHKVWT